MSVWLCGELGCVFVLIVLCMLVISCGYFIVCLV